MEIEIKPANWRDFAPLRTLQKEIIREAEHLAATGKDRKEPIFLALGKAFLHRKRTLTFVACEGKKFVGYITIVFGKFRRVRETVYIAIGVKESHQGRGVGTKLLKRAEDFARERGMHRIELEVFANHEKAIGLYEKLGFQIEGRRREAAKTNGGYIDIVWMGKLLS